MRNDRIMVGYESEAACLDQERRRARRTPPHGVALRLHPPHQLLQLLAPLQRPQTCDTADGLEAQAWKGRRTHAAQAARCHPCQGSVHLVATLSRSVCKCLRQ